MIGIINYVNIEVMTLYCIVLQHMVCITLEYTSGYWVLLIIGSSCFYLYLQCKLSLSTCAQYMVTLLCYTTDYWLLWWSCGQVHCSPSWPLCQIVKRVITPNCELACHYWRTCSLELIDFFVCLCFSLKTITHIEISLEGNVNSWLLHIKCPQKKKLITTLGMKLSDKSHVLLCLIACFKKICRANTIKFDRSNFLIPGLACVIFKVL